MSFSVIVMDSFNSGWTQAIPNVRDIRDAMKAHTDTYIWIKVSSQVYLSVRVGDAGLEGGGGGTANYPSSHCW